MSGLEFGMEKGMRSRTILDLDSWSALASAEQRVLGVLFHKYAGQTFSSLLPSEDWAKEGLSGAEAKLAFAMLCHKGWIKSVYKSWGERSFYIPAYHLATLTLAYVGRVGRMVEPMVGSIRRVIKEGKPHIAAELLHLLAWIEREGLPVTGKGTIHKRNIQKLSTLTILSHVDFEQLGITYDHRDLYSVDVVILLDLLLSLNLLQKTDEGFEIRQDQLQQWTKLPWSVMHKEIFQVCMDRYGTSGAALQHFRYQLVLLAPGLDEWCRIRDGKKNVGIVSWLHALAGWGFGETSEDENGELAFRWLINPANLLNVGLDCVHKQGEKQSGGFYVQPNFEVMVPPDVPAEVCWRLENCSERITRDHMSIYRITKERIEKAVANGVKWEVIADFFQEHGQGGLPEHVLAALKDWAKDSKNVYDNPLFCAFSLGAENELSEDHGLVVAKTVETLNNSSNSDSGLIQVQHMRGIKSDESDEQDDESNLVRDIHEKTVWNKRKSNVPETWHREWRKYHLSTARQIAVQAIEWQVKLGIKKGDTTFILIPHQVEGHERWTLEGWCILDPDKPTSLTEWRTFIPESFDSMRLILPDGV